jgi:hypothetical protein
MVPARSVVKVRRSTMVSSPADCWWRLPSGRQADQARSMPSHQAFVMITESPLDQYSRPFEARQ